MAEQTTQSNLQISWKAILAGVFIAALILFFLFRSVFCFYTFEAPLVPWISGITGVLVVLLSSLFKTLDGKALKSLANLLMSLLVTLAVVILITPLAAPQLDKNFCVADFETLVELIELEGEAVLHKDMNVIKRIYTSESVIARADTNEVWPAYIYYSKKFTEEDHCMVSHADYTVTEYTNEQVKITTSSMGSYGLPGKGCNMTYKNPPGADQWTFQKINGEWKIISLEFNLHQK